MGGQPELLRGIQRWTKAQRWRERERERGQVTMLSSMLFEEGWWKQESGKESFADPSFYGFNAQIFCEVSFSCQNPHLSNKKKRKTAAHVTANGGPTLRECGMFFSTLLSRLPHLASTLHYIASHCTR